ncbi:hypothetical protein LWX53_07115 [bacterium]|nr:hypothetical protein [bacterium]
MKKVIIALAISVVIAGTAFCANSPTTTTVPKATTTTVAPSAAILSVTGVVQKIVAASTAKKTGEQLVVLVDGKEMTLAVSTAIVVKDAKGKSVKLSALTKGTKVVIGYSQTANGGNEAVSVTVTK